MLIVPHVLLALGAIALSIFANIRPSSNKLRSSYGLAVGTLASGILLIIVNSADILRTCLTGITFFGAVTILNELARKKVQISNKT